MGKFIPSFSLPASIVLLFTACSHVPHQGLSLQGAMNQEAVVQSEGVLRGQVSLTQMQLRTLNNDHLQALISLTSHIDEPLGVAYQVQWLDDKNNIVSGVPDQWVSFSIKGKERQVILTTAPDASATAYRFLLKPKSNS